MAGELTVPATDEAPDADDGQQPVAAPAPRPARPPAPPAPASPDIQGAAYVAANREPDRHAKVVDLASRLRMSPAFVEQNYDALAKTADQATTETEMGSVSPTLRNWLSNPDNASIAKKEIAPLSQIDTGAKLLVPTPKVDQADGSVDAVGVGIASGMSDLAMSANLLAAAFGHQTPHAAAEAVSQAAQRSASLRAQAPAYAQEYAKAVAEHEGDLRAAGSALLSKADELQKQGTLSALSAFAGAGGRTLGETLSLIGAHVSSFDRIKGLAYAMTEGVASMAPIIASGAAGTAIGTVVPGVGNVAGGMAGTFIGAAALNVGSAIQSEVQKRFPKLDMADPAQVEKVLSDPSTMASVRKMALAGGLTNAAVMTLFSGLAGKVVGARANAAEKAVVDEYNAGGVSWNEMQARVTVARAAAEKATPLAESVVRKVAGAGLHASGVGVGGEAGAAAEGEPVDPGRAISTTLQMLGFGAVSEAIGESRRAYLPPDTHLAAAQAYVKTLDALKAQHDAQALSELGQAVKDAPTTASVPERLKALIETATGGPDASTVYFQTDDWNRYWQGKGASPVEAAAAVMGDEGKAYHDATAAGSRLAIPLSDYLTRVGPSEHFEGLLPDARTVPDGMSFAEAREHLESVPATMQDLADEATKQAAGEEAPLESSAQQVRTDVEKQLQAAGVGPVAAKAQAQVYEAAFRTLGARANVSARELFNRYGLTIGRGPLEPTPEALATMEQARIAGENAANVAPSNEAKASTLYQSDRSGVGPRPRTASGRLKALSKVEPNDLAQEYRMLTDMNARPDAKPEDVAARKVTLGKLEAEMAKRGMDPKEAYMAGGPHLGPQPEGDFYARRMLDVGKQRAAELEASGMREPRTLEQAARAKITFGDNRTFNIELLKNADRSSFLHESAHFFLEVMSDLATAKGASDDLKTDYQTVRDWVGAAGDEPFTTEQHEQFARGFEAYLMEGKAPSPELRSAFYRFKNWLVGVYKNLTALHVELTPEVRQVFDRMLASQDEIQQAEQQGEAHALFPDPRQAGMTEEQATAYTKAVQNAHEAAESQLTTDLMKQIRREESKEWKAQRKPIEEQVTNDLQERPVYKALSYLTDHTNPDGSPLPDGSPDVKLSKAALVGAYGKDILNGVPRGTLATEGGVHPDVVADLFGFQNGRELVDALRAAPKMADAIRTETDAEMQNRYGERMTDADVKAKATAAINGDARGKLLKLEAEHLFSQDFQKAKGLTKAITAPVIPDEVLKQRAAEIIGGTKMRAIRPDLFEQAVARSGKEAVEKLLAGDFAGAAGAKAKQRLARAVADAATEAKAQQDIAFERFKKVFQSDTKLEKTRDLSFINGARALLAGLGIGASDKGAGDYLESVKTYAPDAYENVQAITEDLRALGITDYRDLTGDQFQELHDTVRQLWTLSRKAKQVILENKRLDLAEALKPIVANVLARQSERLATRGQQSALTMTDKVEGVALGAAASLRRAESFARAMDGLDVNGPLSRVIREVFTATDSYRLHKTAVVEGLAEAAKGLERLPKIKDVAAPELGGYVFRDTKELLGAMLHTGAAEGPTSNLTKLLVGRGWGTVDEHGVLDRTNWDRFVNRLQRTGVLTKAHYDWLQSAWDSFESLKPQLQYAYEDVNGRFMKEVKATRFSTPFGEYNGGYYPAIGDTHVAGGAEIDNAMRASEDALLGTDSKFLFTQPASGMTKTRTGKTWPLVMDASQLPRHLDAVLKYIHMAAPVREVFKVVNHRDFREAMTGINPAMVNDALIPFLRAASSQRSSAPETTALGHAIASFINYARTGATQQVVGANLTIAVEQLLHTSAIQSMRTPDNKAMVYYHDVAAATAKLIFSPKKLTDWIHEQSPAVATRDHTRLDMAERNVRNILDPSVIRETKDTIAHAVDLVGHLLNSVMDKAVWLGSYDRAVARGIEGKDAVHYADAVVRQGLGGHNPEDVSRVERGTALTKAMLGMYGFHNTKANQLGTDAFAKTLMAAGVKRSKMRMATVAVYGLLAVGMSGAAARDIIGGRKRKDDETWGDTLGEWAGWGTLDALARMALGGALVTTPIEMFFHKSGASADNTLSSPTANVAAQAAGTGRAAGRLVRGEPITSKDVKDVLGLFGTFLHLPLKAVARPIGYQMDVNAGKAHPSGAGDYVRGLLTGTGSR